MTAKLSIVICTFNRYRDLELLLNQLNKQIENLSEIELIVIDNNSSDQTASVIKKFPKAKYFLETKQGSSAARNRAINEAQGDLICFLDDDVMISDTWLECLLNLSQNYQGEDIAYGARVIPLWSKALPNWLRLEPPFEIIQSCFPAHDYGEEIKTYPFALANRKIQNPISACFLCSKSVFVKYGKFREDLGIIGKQRGACEDTEFFWRLLAAKVPIIYQPKLAVKHPIPESRMTQDFVLAWYELIGKTLEYMKSQGLVHHNPKAQSSCPYKLTFQLAIYYCLYYLSFLSFNPAVKFWFKAQIAKTKGQLSFDILEINPIKIKT